jgi:photosystem II stability/assembly factor-like uncharacterized protein
MPLRGALLLAAGAGALQAPVRVQTARKAVALDAGRRDFVQGVGAAALAPAVLAGATPAGALDVKRWSQVPLPVSTTLFDIAFDTPDHGYLVGAKGTFLETVDGGRSWKPRVFANLDEEEEVGYRFEKVSFKGGEGWVVGKPSVLLCVEINKCVGCTR